MRKISSLFILLMMILTGCQTGTLNHQTVIDWIDFIKWNGKMYDGIYTGALADEKYIGEKLGEVNFKVADNITDTDYKIKNGDAAFHEKGTNFFTIKGSPNLIAVKSFRAINGYAIYYSRDDSGYKWQFKNMPIEKVNRVEIYPAYTSEAPERIAEIKNPEQISHFLQILKDSKESPNFEPNTEKGDPDYYYMVLYTVDPVAYKFDLLFDGHTYYWYLAEPSILSNDIQAFFPKK
ncbi:hypothetical protein [Neobacillus soli]|uniref:hypothetical protein n=1 Tax=Neobacillus soli TaxID=220688 RepID=UPI000824A849|nr:hypothetical protein [Neobacillus soli]